MFHCRFGPWFEVTSTIEGFEPIYHRRALEATALAACRGRVLDVGAAAGRNSLLLRDKGHEVVALDVELLAEGRMRDFLARLTRRLPR